MSTVTHRLSAHSFLSSDAPSLYPEETISPPQSTIADVPERWARALDHALHAGVEILTTPAGERFASSGEHLDVIYRVTADTCDCARALAGDPVCPHRAALRFVLGSLPVVLLHVDDLPADIHADDCACSVCLDSLEAAMWGWIADAHAANEALELRASVGVIREQTAVSAANRI